MTHAMRRAAMSRAQTSVTKTPQRARMPDAMSVPGMKPLAPLPVLTVSLMTIPVSLMPLTVCHMRVSAGLIRPMSTAHELAQIKPGIVRDLPPTLARSES